MEKINFNIMSIRVSSRENHLCNECFKVIVPIGISRETVESLLSVNTPYKVNRPKRKEIEIITNLYTLEEALEYVNSITFTIPSYKRKEKVTKILVDSFLYDPGFTTLYKSSNNITFFNTINNQAQKYLAGELYFSCRNGNYYHYGEYSLEKEKIGLTLYKWNLYYVIHCTETITENKVLKY